MWLFHGNSAVWVPEKTEFAEMARLHDPSMCGGDPATWAIKGMRAFDQEAQWELCTIAAEHFLRQNSPARAKHRLGALFPIFAQNRFRPFTELCRTGRDVGRMACGGTGAGAGKNDDA